MPEDSKLASGQIAYEAYYKKSEGKSLITGTVLPEWKDLNTNIQEAWSAAADAVIVSCKPPIPPDMPH